MMRSVGCSLVALNIADVPNHESGDQLTGPPRLVAAAQIFFPDALV